MKKDVIIVDQTKFSKIKNAMRLDGVDKLHVLSDFDRTLTYAYNGSENTPSIISLIRKSNYLTPDYAPAAYALYDKYAPIEIDPHLSRTEKFAAMQAWWEKHFALLAKSGLTKSVIDKIISKHEIIFRTGTADLLKWTDKNKVPFVIMSASVTDMIEGILKQEELLFENIHVISNKLKFDSTGNFISINLPIVHSLNKYEIILKDFPIFQTVKSRPNVLLLGDIVDDIGMVEGFAYQNLLKIGFLSDKEYSSDILEQYMTNFDIILTGDQNMDYVNKIISEIYS